MTNTDIEANSELLIKASFTGNIQEVKRLIPVSDPKFRDSAALRWAAEKGHTEIVECLIPVSDPNAEKGGSNPLGWAAEQGHIECVKLLIPVSDATSNDNFALRVAEEYEHKEIIQLLLPVSDYKQAVLYMRSKNRSTTLLTQCIEEYESQLLQQTLTAELQSVADIKQSSEKRKM